jgi:predicted DNA-binding transcriptional regulator AlpA
LVASSATEEASLPRKDEHLTADDLKVLTLREFAALNGFSFMTAKRLFKRGQGPVTIQLSPKRVGVRMIDARRWQEARLRRSA